MGKKKGARRRSFGLPHRDYARRRKDLESLFTCDFPDLEDGATDMGSIGHETKIPQTTLYRWHVMWRTDPGWRPWGRKTREADPRRIFSEGEETALREFIIANYVVPGALFTNADFQRIAIEAYLTKHRDSENPPPFNCSKGFINDFKRRNSFSSRRAHYKRRPKREAMIEDAWTDEMRTLLDTVPDPDRVINCDETCWRVYPDGLKTWMPTGSDHVTISIRGNEKQSFTALCSITASRRKLPMVMIAKGKTWRVEQSQLGDIEPHLAAHSESGWITIPTFEEYLAILKSAFPGEEPIYLILDCYSVHRSQEIREYARHLGIIMKFIPPGTTDSLQPLDRAVFGTLKGIARRLFRMEATDSLCPHLTLQLAAQFLVRAWEQVSTQVLDHAWSIYEPFDE
jgi:hypothetical protein